MATGKVRTFNSHKGYGYIQPDDGGADIFIDISDVQKSGLPALPMGTQLSYEVVIRRNGLRCAEHLRITARHSTQDTSERAAASTRTTPHG